MAHELAVPHLRQPDDLSCGPTCLAKVLAFYKDTRDFDTISAAVTRNADGGTLAVFLGIAAVSLGYRVTIYPFGLQVFDPTWRELGVRALREKIARRAVHQAGQRQILHEAYVRFLEVGGHVHLTELTEGLLMRLLDRGRPLLCGLSATWLYRTSRERPEDMVDDDEQGESAGHFVVLTGYTGDGGHFFVSDPSAHAPFAGGGRYTVESHRLMTAILLGESTYDAVLLEIWPREGVT